MKVCISPRSLKLLAAYFNSKIPDLVKDNKNFNQILKELYDKALSDFNAQPLSIGETINLDELILQHLTIAPQLILNHITHPEMQIEFGNYELIETTAEFMDTAYEAIRSNSEDVFEQYINNLAKVIGVNQVTAPVGQVSVGRWEAIRVPLYATINNEATYDEENDTYKSNIVENKDKIFTADIQRNIINNGNVNNYFLKLIPFAEVKSNPDVVVPIEEREQYKLGDYVLVLTNSSGEIVKFNEQGVENQYGRFPIFIIKGSRQQFEYQRKDYIKKNSDNEKEAAEKFDEEIQTYLNWLTDSINKVKNNETVMFTIDLANSNTGTIEKNIMLQTNLSEITNIDSIPLEIVNNGTANNAAIRIENYNIPLNIYEKPFDTLDDEQIEIFIELLTNNKLLGTYGKLKGEQRLKYVQSYMPTIKLGTFGRVPFNVTVNQKYNGDITRISLFNSTTQQFDHYKISAGKVQSEEQRELNKQTFVKAFKSWISSYHLVPLNQNFTPPQNYIPLTGTAEEVLAGVTKQQEFVIVDGVKMMAMKPTISHGLFPTIRSISSDKISLISAIKKNSVVENLVPLREHIINNSFTDVVPNTKNELRSYFPFLGFKPMPDATALDNISDDVFGKFQSISEQSQKDEIISGLFWTEETLAMEWIKESGFLQVLNLAMKDDFHTKGPQFVASFIGNTINLWKGSNKTAIYHEVFHAYFDGLLTENERKAVYSELRSKNKGKTFNVTVNGVAKEISFETATELELEEFLAEEFRAYARNRSIYNNKLKYKSKVAQFFAKLIELFKKMFGNRSYAEVVALNFVSEDVQTLFKNLYEIQAKDVADFTAPQTSYEKYQSFEVAKSIEITNAQLNKGMEAMQSLYVEFIDRIVNPNYASEMQRMKAAELLIDVAKTRKKATESDIEFQDRLDKKQKEFLMLYAPQGKVLNTSGNNSIIFQNNPALLIAALEYIKTRLERIKSKNSQNNNIVAIENTKMLDIILKNFGDYSQISSEGFGYLADRNDSMMAIFLNNFTPLDLKSKEFFVDDFENRNEEGAWNFDREDPDIMDDIDQHTRFMLSTLTAYEFSGTGKAKESSLGLNRFLSYKAAVVKVANAIADVGTTSEDMYDALVIAGAQDKSLKQLTERLGNPRNANTKHEQQQWGNFLRSLNKKDVKPIHYTVEKTDVVGNENLLNLDEENKEYSKLESRLGKTSNKLSAQLSNWSFNFQSLITDNLNVEDQYGNTLYTEIPIRNTEGADAKYIKGIDPQAFSNKWGEQVWKFPNSNLIYSDAEYNQLKKENPKLDTKGVVRNVRYRLDPVGMLNDLGITLAKTEELKQILLKGNEDVDSKTLTYIYEFVSNRQTAVKESNTLFTSLKDLNYAFNYKVGDETLTQPSLKGYVEQLTRLGLKMDEYSMSFMEYTADGERISTKTFHSSLTIELVAINKAKHINEIINTPGFEYFDYTRNPEIAANLSFVKMFQLDATDERQRGVRNESIKFTLENLTGAEVIYNGKSKGVRSIKSDEKTKFNTDFDATLRNHQEILRSEAKSTAPVVVMPVYKDTDRSVRTEAFSNTWLSNEEAFSLLEDNYDGRLLFDIYKNQIESELVRMTRLKAVQEKIDNGETVLFDPEFLERGNSWIKFKLLLSKKVKDRLEKLNLSDSFTIESQINEKDPTLIKDIENDLLTYFSYKSNQLYKEKNNDLVLTDNVLQKYKLENESVQITRLRMFHIFTIHNHIQNLNYASTFIGDPANFDIEGGNFHKRIIFKITAGRMMNHSESWYNWVNSDNYNRDSFAEAHFNKLSEEERAKRNLPKTFTKRMYNGYLATAILKEAKSNSIYRDHYNQLFGLDPKKYSDMAEADGAAYVSFDTYKLLAESHQEWSEEQDILFKKYLAGEKINELEFSTSFPVRKYHMGGPVHSSSVENQHGLQLTGFHKYAVIPLIPHLIENTPLQEVHEMMMEQGIDYVTFQTGSKLSNVVKINKENGAMYDAPYVINEDQTRNIDRSVEFTKNYIHVRSLKSVVQQGEGFHGESSLGSQMSKINLVGLFDENAIPLDFEKGKKRTKALQKKWNNLSYQEKLLQSDNFRWSEEYSETFGELMDLAKEILVEDLGLTREVDANGNITFKGSTKKFGEYLKKELANKQLTAEEIDFIFDSNTKELIPDLSLSLNASKIEDVLVKLADDSLRKMKFKGEPLVQVPGTMLEGIKPTLATEDDVFAYGNNGLSTYYGLKEDGTVATSKDDIKYVKSMEVKISLQGDFKKLLYLDFKGEIIIQYKKESIINRTLNDNGDIVDVEEMIVNTSEVDFEASLNRLNEALLDQEWRAEHLDLITIPSTRIPTSQFSMLESATIKQFLRPSSGNIIILPSEIVAKSGSDFDIDKLFALFPHIIKSKGKVKLAQHIKGIKETRSELNIAVLKASGEVEKIRDEINALFKKKEEIFNNSDQNTKEIAESLQPLKDIIEDLKKKRDKVRNEGSKAFKKEGKYKDYTNEQVKEIHHGPNGTVSQNKEYNRLIDEKYQELKTAWKIAFPALYEEANKEIEIKQKELEKAEAVYEEALDRFHSKSFKALQNKILLLLNERILNKDMMDRLIEPNSTDFFQDIADDLSKKLTVDYNKYEVSSIEDIRNNTPKFGDRIASSTAFDYRYNLLVHQENSKGLEALGVAAVTSTFYALLTQFGATLKGLSENEQANYNKSLAIVQDDLNGRGNYTASEIKNAQNVLSQYKSYSLKFPHNKMNNTVSVSFIKNIEGRPIQDVIGQLINGFVDVAKKPWVFDIQGNMQNVPQMLLMVMAGMKVEDVVYFSAQPFVLEYNKIKSELSGLFSNLTNEVDVSPFTATSDIQQRARNIIYEKYSEVINSNVFVQASGQDLFNFLSNSLDSEVLAQENYLYKNVGRKITTESAASDIVDQFALLSHYFSIEDMANDFTAFTMALKFDTKKPRSFTEYQDRIEEIEKLKTTESSIPNEWYDNLIEYDENFKPKSILAAFNNDKFIMNLFNDRFLIRNHPFLTLKSIYSSKPKNIDKAQAFIAFKDDFSFYLYQNSFFKNSTFDNYKFISDSNMPEGVLIDVKGNDVYYNLNAIRVNKINLEQKIGDFFPTIEHYLRYLVELEKINAEFSEIKDVTNNNVTVSAAQQIKEKYYYLKTSSFQNLSIADIKTKLALWRSKNNVAFFDYRMGVMTMLTNMKKKHPDLIQRFLLIENLKIQYNPENKKANFYLEDIDDATLVKIYKENLQDLKNSEYPEVAELFQLFDHLAIMQAGASATGLTNMARIIDQNIFYDVIESEIGTEGILNQLDEGSKALRQGVKFKEVSVPLVDNFIQIYKEIITDWYSRKRGINLMVDKFDSVTAGEEISHISKRNVKVYTKFEGIEIPYPKLTLENLITESKDGTLSLNWDFINENVDKKVAVINKQILSVENPALQKELNEVLENYFSIDNTGDVLIVKDKSIGQTADNISIVGSEELRNKHSYVDEQMANNSTLAIGQESEFAVQVSVAYHYANVINKKYPERLANNKTKFTDKDKVWVFGSHAYESAYKGVYTEIQWNEILQRQFDKYYAPLIDKAIKANVRTFNVGTATGIDKLAFDYLKKKGYYPMPTYLPVGKYFEFMKMDEKTPTSNVDIYPGEFAVTTYELGFSDILFDETLQKKINKLSENELFNSDVYQSVKTSVLGKIKQSKLDLGSLREDLINTMGKPITFNTKGAYGMYQQLVEEVLLDIRREFVAKKELVLQKNSIQYALTTKQALEKSTGLDMNYGDGSWYKDENDKWQQYTMQDQFKGKSTMDLTISGDRTRSTRTWNQISQLMEIYNLQSPQQLVGKIIPVSEFQIEKDESDKRVKKLIRKAYVVVTNVAEFTQEYQDKTWQKEGWTKNITDRLVGKYKYAIEWKFLTNETITKEDILNLTCKG